MFAHATLIAALLGAEPLEISSTEPTISSESRGPADLGAVAAPAVLPRGGLALSGLLGAPELGAIYRQGFTPLELEARGLFNYLELSVIAEAGARFGVLRSADDRLAVAVGASGGLKFNSGARYYDRANFSYVGLRLRAALHLSYRLTATVVGVGVVDLPWTVALDRTGYQVTPTVGAGPEFHVGERLSLLASLHGGFEVTREPLGVPQARLAWAIRLGVGYRLF